MESFEELRQVSNALHVLMFAPKEALMDLASVDWRFVRYSDKLANSEFSGLTDAELEQLRVLVHKPRYDVECTIRAAQLLAYLLHGAIGAVAHESDLADALISESMLYSANMHLTAGQAETLRNLCDDFARRAAETLGYTFGPMAALTAEEQALLEKADLYTR